MEYRYGVDIEESHENYDTAQMRQLFEGSLHYSQLLLSDVHAKHE
jgi:hypothetical protein